jgi:hypothetical protein
MHKIRQVSRNFNSKLKHCTKADEFRRVLIATSVSSLAVENGGKTFRTCAGHFRLFMGQWYVNFGLLISE